MTVFMSILLLLLGCVSVGIVAKLAIDAVVNAYMPPGDWLWLIGYTALGTICVRMALLLLSGAYPND